MSATVDLIGTTYSTRLGIDSIESGTAIETSDQLCVIDQLDASDATDLPALKRLLEAGATVAVHRGCPMLRVHRVPTHPDAQRWLEQLTCEFGSVRDALQARTSEHVTNNVLAAAAAAREWDDEPLCAMMVPQSESQTVVDAVVKQQLAPALAWRLECERPALLPLAAPQVMISASSADDLEQLMSTQERRNVHAVALAFGAAPHNSDRVMELLWPSVQQLRLLTVAGSVDMPSDFFERLMGANSTLVVAWYCDRNSDRSHWRANIMSVSV